MMRLVVAAIAAVSTAAIILLVASSTYEAPNPDKPDIDATASEVKSFQNPTVFNNSATLDAYIAERSAKLSELAISTPDMEVTGAISFKVPITQENLNSIVAEHDLNLRYFEWTASGGISGGGSTMLYPDFKRFEESKNVEITGATYLIVVGKAADLERLNDNTNVILVDIGYSKEIKDEEAAGNTGTMNRRPNLHYWYEKFN